MSVLFEAIGHLRGREDFQKAGLYTLIVGFAGAILAFLSGRAAEESVEAFMGRHPGGIHLLLAAVGLGSISYTGYLGGELTHPEGRGAPARPS